MPRTRTKKYPGSLTRRGTTWRVRLCVGGAYRSFTVRGTEQEAKNFATVTHAALTTDLGRATAGLPDAIRFSELLKDFLEYRVGNMPRPGTRKSYTSSLDTFGEFFVDRLHDPYVRDIRKGHVASFLEWRSGHRVGDATGKAGVSLHTVRRDRRVLSLLFNYAITKDHVDANPCFTVKALRPDRREPVILSPEHFEALLTAATPNPMLHTYVLLLAETGARSDSEALPLRWADVDFASGFVRLTSPATSRNKNGKQRSVPLSPRLKVALQEHAARYRMAVYGGERSPFVFHHTHTTRSAVAGQPIKNPVRMWKVAAKAAQMPTGFRRHDLRHRRVTTWLEEGRNVVFVMEAMGHSDLATTMGYWHLVSNKKLLDLVAVQTPIVAVHSAR